MGNEAPKAPSAKPESDEDKMFNTMFEFKMMSKTYAKEAEKAAAAEKASVKKVKNVRNNILKIY
jgi:hypothetical protein